MWLLGFKNIQFLIFPKHIPFTAYNITGSDDTTPHPIPTPHHTPLARHYKVSTTKFCS